jgi:hypothetical protein
MFFKRSCFYHGAWRIGRAKKARAGGRRGRAGLCWTGGSVEYRSCCGNGRDDKTDRSYQPPQGSKLCVETFNLSKQGAVTSFIFMAV